MNKHFHAATSAIPELFAELAASTPFTAKGVSMQKGRAGVYVFLENGVPVHVGRTRNLGERLRGHISKSHFSASFAFKRTRAVHGKTATYLTKGSRRDLLNDPDFKETFHQQVQLVKGMTVLFVEVTDPVQQYLLELYAHLEFGLPLDEFDTH
ncbi:hypothetical protein [Bradyrhizobium huanghuaihaiense]|nr:hypothetical protein [Bradyrhizobium huanghuaihaiense]